MMEKQEKTLDQQFHDVSIAFADAHAFTDFCYTRLDDKITGVAKDVGNLTTAVRTLGAKVSTLDAKVSTLDTKVSTLDTRMGSLEAKVASLDTRVGSLETKVTNLDTKVTTLTTTMDRRFTRSELLLTEVLNEVKLLRSTPI